MMLIMSWSNAQIMLSSYYMSFTSDYLLHYFIVHTISEPPLPCNSIIAAFVLMVFGTVVKYEE